MLTTGNQLKPVQLSFGNTESEKLVSVIVVISWRPITYISVNDQTGWQFVWKSGAPYWNAQKYK